MYFLKGLFPYQKECVDNCLKNDYGIVDMCCGSGKTRCELEVCLNFKRSCIVAPRNILLQQHYDNIKELTKHLDIDLTDIIHQCDTSVTQVHINKDININNNKDNITPYKKLCDKKYPSVKQLNMPDLSL